MTNALVFRKSLPSMAAAFAFARITGRPAVFPGGPLRLETLEEPELPGAGWVRVASTASGICGSDIHLLRLDASPRSSILAWRDPSKGEPGFPGHETAGRVVESHSSRFKPGDRVILVPGFHCRALSIEPQCLHCLEGSISHCSHRNARPTVPNLGGGWSERFVRHESQLIACPENIPDEIACLVEPSSAALHCVLRRPPTPGDKVLVIGAGAIGLAIIASLRALRIDIRIAAVCRHDFQRRAAQQLGADHCIAASADLYESSAEWLGCRVSGKNKNRVLTAGYSVVYDAVGTPETIGDSLRLCRTRGAVVIVGCHMHPRRFDHTPIWHQEIDLIGSMGFADDLWEGERVMTMIRTSRWLAEGRLDLSPLRTDRFSLNDYRAAISTASGAARRSTGANSSPPAIRVAFSFA